MRAHNARAPSNAASPAFVATASPSFARYGASRAIAAEAGSTGAPFERSNGASHTAFPPATGPEVTAPAGPIRSGHCRLPPRLRERSVSCRPAPLLAVRGRRLAVVAAEALRELRRLVVADAGGDGADGDRVGGE